VREVLLLRKKVGKDNRIRQPDGGFLHHGKIARQAETLDMAPWRVDLISGALSGRCQHTLIAARTRGDCYRFHDAST
jgi:hypothetical protein